MLQYLPDVPDLLKPVDSWSNLQNATWRNGAAYRDLGEGTRWDSGTASIRYEWVYPFRTSGVDSMLYAGRTSGGNQPNLATYIPGTGHTNETTASWTAAAAVTSTTNLFTGGFLGGGILVNCYGLGAPVWFSQTALTATDLDATLRFAALRPYKYFAVGIADKNTPSRGTVRWSDAVTPGTAPTTWTPAATNQAGDFDLSGAAGGELVDGGQLGEDFVIYGPQSMHLMTYVGGSQVMVERRISSSTGIMGRNCWADVGNGHVVLTPDDVVLVTPAGVQSLCDAKARALIIASVYASNYPEASQVWYERKRNRVWIAYTASTVRYMSQAWVLDLTTGQWGRKALSRDTSGAMQIEGAATTEPYLGLATPSATLASNGLYKDDTDGGSGSGVASQWQKHDLDMGDAMRRKFVRGIRVLGDTGGGPTGIAGTIKVQIGTKNSVEESYTYGSVLTFALGSTQQAPVLADGRYFSLLLDSNANTDKAYSVIGFELDWDWAAGW